MPPKSKLDVLIKGRTVLRSSVTRSSNKIQEILSKEELLDLDREELRTQLQLMSTRFEELTTKDVEINAEYLDSDDTEKLEADQAQVDEYTASYLQCKNAVESILEVRDESVKNLCRRSSSSRGSVIECCQGEVNNRFKLPTLKLKEFNGTIGDWLPFWSQFSKIDQDANIHNVDKLGYLSMSMVPNSPAAKLVQSYPATGDMYSEVVKALKTRFGRTDLLTEYYIRQLLKIVLQNNSVKQPISVLYDTLQCHLRNLEALDVSVDNNAAILMPLVSSCLPDSILQIWERSCVPQLVATNPEATSKDHLKSLLLFIQAEVEGQQKLTMAKEGFGLHAATATQRPKSPKSMSSNTTNRISTAAGLVNTSASQGESRLCIFCSGNHSSQDCKKAIHMPLEKRQECVRKSNACYCCLKKGHRASHCRKRPRCGKCDKSHFDLMCSDTGSPQNDLKGKTVQTLTSTCKTTVLLQTLVVKVKNETSNGWKYARLMYDSGSQQSYILDSSVKQLGYKPLGTETVQHALFGGEVTKPVQHNVYKLVLSSLDDTYECTLDVFGQNQICSPIPTVPPGPWLQELEENNIHLSDLNYPTTDIEILIGADIAGKLFTGKHLKLSCGLVAIDTSLGWTLSGKVPGSSKTVSNAANIVTSLFVRDATVSDLWNLDILGITEPTEVLSKKEMDKATMDHFLATVAVDDDGRFQVHLPFVNDHAPLASNYDLSMKRLNNTITKLKRDGYYEDYQKVLDEWELKGIIETVPEEEAHLITHYLPHRHVIKIGSTTPIRPVFDASAHESNKPCLNDCLEKGPNLIEKIPTSLAKFRHNKIGISGDIAKAFLQISVNPKDRDYLRFLWQCSDGQIKTYRHCRVVFGVSSSPFLLESCLKLHLEETMKLCKESKIDWPLPEVEMLAESFYVDNCLVSVQSEIQAKKFMHMASSIMIERGFDLRGWEYSGQENANKPSNILGLSWDKADDTLMINIESVQSMEFNKITKKIILSAAHRIFDPIGFVCSVVLIPKLLLQQTWEQKLTWSEEVDKDTQSKFHQWLEEIHYLAEIKFPRWIADSSDPEDKKTIHVFSDACKFSYACVIFLRIENQQGVSIRLLAARARVAPSSKSKNLTIPRLELLAASIATRLYTTVVKDFKLSGIETIFWTDATTVLAWIKRTEPWNVFVMNRVKEIRTLSEGAQWRHVPGELNPADLPSRGCLPKKLLQCRWWEGPGWLIRNPEYWPEDKSEATNEADINAERKKTIVSSMVVGQEDNTDWYYSYFSDYKKIVRMIGWIKRFKANTILKKNGNLLTTPSDLTAHEICEAEKTLLFCIQKEVFPKKEEDLRLKNLLPFIDEDSLLRIKTKISNRPDDTYFCSPIVLPNAEHPVVHRLIMEEHKNNSHAGAQTLLAILRKRFWILGSRRTIKSVLKTCVICKRYSAKKLEVVPTPLPVNRVQDTRVFEIIGVDFAGPLYVKENENTRKAWICIFTCAVYRAVRFELVPTLSTNGFVQALRRFSSRQGRPKVIYCDNGTNFVGFHNACSALDWNKITTYSSVRRIEMIFNPPSSPWWGGWWERMIGLMKDLLRRILGRTSVDYVELQTIICECEATINSRPLTYLSSDSSDLYCITPSLFLHDLEEDTIPEHDVIQIPDLNRKLKHSQEVRRHLCERFRLEYLGNLQLFSNKKKPHHLKIGEIVLIGDDNVKRFNWPLGRIIKLIQGADGHVRVLKIRTSTGILTRPVQRVYPLEFQCSLDELTPDLVLDGDSLPEPSKTRHETDVSPHEDSSAVPCQIMPETDQSAPESSFSPNDLSCKITRHGRTVKKPAKLNL